MTRRGMTQPHQRLGLRAGDWVEVLPLPEILATLDEKGALDALPFMPEMIASCGKRFRVLKSAHKTCDRVEKSGLRRMKDTVHLDELRCDGGGHGGCQAVCLVFWKEAWLKRVEGPHDAFAAYAPGAPGEGARAVPPVLADAVRAPSDAGAPGEVRWSCQATEMFRATFPMKWWDPRAYLRDVTSGNASLGAVIRWLLIRSLNQIQRIPRTYTVVESVRGSLRYPRVEGALKRTPRSTLDLSPGDPVRVKSAEEIRATLDTRGRNRGLSFDMEMVRYCGGTYDVRSRVTRLIDEPTGRMMEPPNDCIILDKVVCTAEYHGLCPRAIYPYWREIWLERAGVRTTVPAGDRAASAAPGEHAPIAPAWTADNAVLAVGGGAAQGDPVPVPADGSCGQERGKEEGGGDA